MDGAFQSYYKKEFIMEYTAVIRTLGRAGEKYQSLLDSLIKQDILKIKWNSIRKAIMFIQSKEYQSITLVK